MLQELCKTELFCCKMQIPWSAWSHPLCKNEILCEISVFIFEVFWNIVIVFTKKF